MELEIDWKGREGERGAGSGGDVVGERGGGEGRKRGERKRRLEGIRIWEMREGRGTKGKGREG